MSTLVNITTLLRHNNININDTMFFLCDMQERFKPAIFKFDEIVEVAKRMVNYYGLYNSFLLIIFINVLFYTDRCIKSIKYSIISYRTSNEISFLK